MNRLLTIIHLAIRPDRLIHLTNELKTQKLTGCLWPGIKNPTDPRLGISSAHKQIIRYAGEQELESITVEEDDIKFTAPGAFDFYLRQKPDKYDIYLGGILYGNIHSGNIVEGFAGTFLYTINEKFYDRFLSVEETGNIDRLLAGKGKFIVCNPFAAIVYNGYSDNKECYMNYDCYTKGRNLFGP